VPWDGGVTRHFRRNVRKTARVLYGLHVFNAIGGYGSRRDCGCLFGFPSYMIALVVERSPEGQRVPLSTLTTINSASVQNLRSASTNTDRPSAMAALRRSTVRTTTTGLEEIFKQTESLLQWRTELRFAWLHL
jgi:hypothetical protein